MFEHFAVFGLDRIDASMGSGHNADDLVSRFKVYYHPKLILWILSLNNCRTTAASKPCEHKASEYQHDFPLHIATSVIST